LASAFNLTGEGPLFLQDMERLEGSANAPDMLFIDSAGKSTAKKNADLMVKRDRYAGLPLPLAAMALYTLQAHAPSGGAGNRTSMRGGGPMVTLVRPRGGETPLWSLVWANVPEGHPLPPDGLTAALPWMRPTRTSEKKTGVTVEQPATDHTAHEAFFGMPRRLRLVVEGNIVTGVIQKPRGTNYGAWRHPLSPYYAEKEGGVKQPRHPKPGNFAYCNWLGVVLGAAGERQALAFRARSLADFTARAPQADADVLVAGWAMKGAKPLDFIWSEQPLFPLSPEAEVTAAELVEAAEMAVQALVSALKDALGLEKKNAIQLDRAREAFFQRTQGKFEAALSRLASGAEAEPLKRGWLTTLRSVAERQFDAAALPGLAERDIVARGTKGFSRRPTALRIVEAKRTLAGKLRGNKIHQALRLDPPDTATKARAKAKASP
ncbi:MAG: type I-E CRISPR-associated protein Cse1/CasA, partial [Proteobacteria bacterium]|nr:type I-E CRISPR-associated protein Cse1/CasA [Pseudomonadota bacterium]